MSAQPGANKMKVLHIVGDSRFGGIARIILGLGRIARMDGWEVDVLTTDPEVQEALRSQSLGIVSLDCIRRRIQPLRDIAGVFRLRRYLRHNHYAIVHTHTSKGGFIGRLAAWLAGVPVIVHTVHGFAFHEQSPAPVRMICSALERMASRWCHRIVSVSEFHQRWAIELNICSQMHIQAIPNGIEPLRRGDRSKLAALRRDLDIGDGDLLILSPARLAADKGLTYLIEAAAILPRGGPRYRVVIAGDGPVRKSLERLARERGVTDTVRFLGFRRDIGDLLAVSDLVVLPSLREGLSISLLEAMAAGKPIIASSIGSHREMASQAEMAKLVPPANAAALAEAIQQFAGDPELMAHVAASARSLFEARYTEERMLNAYRQMYLSLLERELPVRPTPITHGASIVRRARPEDLSTIVHIHHEAFSHYFLTRLGANFLRLYYELVLSYSAGIVLVSEDHGVLSGFVCGFANPAGFYRLMWRNRRKFALPALAALARHPSLAANMLYGVRRIQNSALEAPPDTCELSSIAVTPQASGNGVGGRLLRAFLEQSWLKNVCCVYLTTDADGNDSANALYRAAGFQHCRRFLQRRGRWMNEYVFRRAQIGGPLETRP